MMMMDDDDAAQSWVAAAHDLRGTNDPCEFTHRFGRMEMILTFTLIARDVNSATFAYNYLHLQRAHHLNNNTAINRNKPNRSNKPDSLDELNKINWLELINSYTGESGAMVSDRLASGQPGSNISRQERPSAFLLLK